MTSPVPKPVWIIPPPTMYDVVGQDACLTCGRHHEGIARRKDPWTPPVYRDLTDCPENADFDRRPPKTPPPPPPAPLAERAAPTVIAPVETPVPVFKLNPPPPPDWGTGPPPPKGH